PACGETEPVVCARATSGPCTGEPERCRRSLVATRNKNRGNGNRQRSNQRSNRRHQDGDGIIPVLARTVREVEHAVQKGQVSGFERTKFQVVALLAREERT